MSRSSEVNDVLRAEHRAEASHLSGGWTWFCSCGKRGETGGSYPTEFQANARRDRHLRAERSRIEKRPEFTL